MRPYSKQRLVLVPTPGERDAGQPVSPPAAMPNVQLPPKESNLFKRILVSGQRAQGLLRWAGGGGGGAGRARSPLRSLFTSEPSEPDFPAPRATRPPGPLRAPALLLQRCGSPRLAPAARFPETSRSPGTALVPGSSAAPGSSPVCFPGLPLSRDCSWVLSIYSMTLHPNTCQSGSGQLVGGDPN